MKKILLLGDSIRMGYDKYIKEALSGAAEVYYPTENCRFASHTLRFIHEWKFKEKWPDDIDLIHWNVGLWDALKMFDDEPLVPLSCYQATIQRIDKRLRILFPKAKLVFATSTAVIEERCSPGYRRNNGTINEYNKAAIKVLSDTDTAINDLYTLTINLPESAHSDGVHYYTNEGVEFIGGRVLSVICSQLGISASEVNLENFEPEKYSAENIGH